MMDKHFNKTMFLSYVLRSEMELSEKSVALMAGMLSDQSGRVASATARISQIAKKTTSWTTRRFAAIARAGFCVPGEITRPGGFTLLLRYPGYDPAPLRADQEEREAA